MVFNKICIMAPTYGRADTKLPVFIRTAIDTVADKKNICFCFVTNTRDVASDRVINEMCGKAGVEYEILHESLNKPHLAKYYNQAYSETRFNAPGTLVSMLGDDMEFKSSGWDLVVLQWANMFDGIGIFFGDDMKGTRDNLCVNFFTSRKFVDAIQPHPFMCEMFPCDDMDVIWNFTAKKLGRKFYLPELKIFHNHATLPGRMDEVWQRLRTTFPEVMKNRKSSGRRDGHVWGHEDYEDECVKSIKKNLPGYFDSDLTVMMTTYNRYEELQETVTSYNNSHAFPPKVYVFDDCSGDQAMIKRIVGNMKNAELITAGQNLGCTRNNLLALKRLFEEEGAKAVLVIDSDVAFNPHWWSAAKHFYEKMKGRENIGFLSVFNADGHKPNVTGDPHLVQKTEIGGLGMIVPRGSFEKYMMPIIESGEELRPWDNEASGAAHEDGNVNYSMTPSFVQHIGIYEGIHVGASGATSAADFVGEVNTYTRYAVNDDPNSKGVLFACMGRYGDIILASYYANQLIEMGHTVTWLTIPMYYKLAQAACPGAIVINDRGNPEADWQTTNTKDMRDRYPLYRYYINCQPGSSEHHNTLMGCGLSTAVFMRKVVERVIGLPLDRDLMKYAKLESKVSVTLPDVKSGKPLCVIAPQNISAPNALDAEKTFEHYSKEYDVRFLVPRKPDGVPIRKVREKYLFGYSFLECIEVIKKAKMFVGNDSGLAWAALYAKNCKKVVYHTKERMRLVNNRFAELDPLATDIEV